MVILGNHSTIRVSTVDSEVSKEASEIVDITVITATMDKEASTLTDGVPTT